MSEHPNLNSQGEILMVSDIVRPHTGVVGVEHLHHPALTPIHPTMAAVSNYTGNRTTTSYAEGGVRTNKAVHIGDLMEKLNDKITV
jgi:hypothetical protein